MSQAPEISLSSDPRSVAEACRLELKAAQKWQFEKVDPAQSPTASAVLAAPLDVQAAVAVACVELRGSADPLAVYQIEGLREPLLRKKLPYTPEQIIQITMYLMSEGHKSRGPDTPLVTILERYVEKNPLPAEAVEQIKAVVARLTGIYLIADGRKALNRLERVVVHGPELHLDPADIWAKAASEALASMPASQRDAWIALWNHGLKSGTGTPSAKWLKDAGKLLDALGRDEFVRRVCEWFPLVDKLPPIEGMPDWQVPLRGMIPARNQETLRGLALAASLCDSPDLARALGQLAISTYKKLPGIGPRAVKVGNACVFALGDIPNMDALGQLALLKVKVKFGGAQIGIEKALNRAAERLQLPREEIEEIAVPTYGLEEVGRRTETLGDFTAELIVSADGSTELRWLKADGKTQKSVPASVTKDFAEDLKELKAAAKDIQKMLPAQRERIDNLFLSQKRWPLAAWRERYLDHPLVGVIARRIIWRFLTVGGPNDGQEQSGIWHEGKIVGHDDVPLALDEGAAEGTVQVEPWHPIGRPEAETLAWRGWLERHEVRQPFKQAHREVYLLTDAERRTGVYSNRFAGHVLKQHQYNALCGVRGWRNQLRLMVDSDYPPTSRNLPQWNLRAEYWVEGAGDNFGDDTNDTGTYLYLTTDQVRFYPLGAQQVTAHATGGGYSMRVPEQVEPVPLEQIPPLVLSEIFRDVDLFVGVSSVGNDPNWTDGGREVRYGAYWTSYSFGDLSATAQTRKAVLERIIPRLKIAPRCTFTDRFLVVRGDLRTYKIHFGSGNILMEPNDQYLCIVPSRGAATAGDKVFLPFEGDGVLSIVLSKAIMLAEDKKITDSTIVSQIERK